MALEVTPERIEEAFRSYEYRLAKLRREAEAAQAALQAELAWRQNPHSGYASWVNLAQAAGIAIPQT